MGAGVFNVTKMMVLVLHKSKNTKWKSSDNEVGSHSAKEKKDNSELPAPHGLKREGA